MAPDREELEKGIDQLYKELFEHRLNGINVDRSEELLKKAEARLKEDKLGECEVYLTKAKNVARDLVNQANLKK
ncbi:MAG: hypothetical protein QW728_07415 [Thermoplasmata archaeon]